MIQSTMFYKCDVDHLCKHLFVLASCVRQNTETSALARFIHSHSAPIRVHMRYLTIVQSGSVFMYGIHPFPFGKWITSIWRRQMRTSEKVTQNLLVETINQVIASEKYVQKALVLAEAHSDDLMLASTLNASVTKFREHRDRMANKVVRLVSKKAFSDVQALTNFVRSNLNTFPVSETQKLEEIAEVPVQKLTEIEVLTAE